MMIPNDMMIEIISVGTLKLKSQEGKHRIKPHFSQILH